MYELVAVPIVIVVPVLLNCALLFCAVGTRYVPLTVTAGVPTGVSVVVKLCVVVDAVVTWKRCTLLS